MKKLNALLHDVTIINFMFVGKLFVRYKKISFLGVFLVITSVCFLYFGQKPMFKKQVTFKIFNRSEGDSRDNKSVIADVIENSLTALKMPEIIALVGTYNFKTTMAEKLAKEEGLDFRSAMINNERSVDNLNKCGKDLNCRKNLLREIAPGLFRLESEMGTGRFLLTVTTFSSQTTLRIVEIFKETLEEVRYKEILLLTENQIEQIEGLITKSRNDIGAKSGFDKLAESDFLNALIMQQSEKLKHLTTRLNTEMDQFSYQKIRLKESHIAASSKIHSEEKLKYESYDKLKRRNAELRQNIGLLNSISSASRSKTDEKILTELKRELEQTEAELKKNEFGKRNIAIDDTFIDTQINNQTNFEFDYKVANAKLEALKKEHGAAKAELDSLFSRKAKMDNELLALKPDLEYLKLLESKLVSIKLKKSAVGSDVNFDQYGNDIAEFKRNSFLQISIFSFLLVGFMLFITQICLFLFDDHIYDEYDIEKCCGDLPVIGQSPRFD